METWKKQIGERALHKGVIDDPSWLERLDEPLPAWAVLQMLLELMDKVEPNYSSYD
ncbi:hypothetical protein ACVNS2_15955 [Paenibacillus caseinilyticus]|uniref:Uncharacterized protein n=1 Tax=Paenibacillus mucilaginosus K02 TaxID=997761 RepID=I0BIE4_9BACL|nr:hypothetical protein [Paenibacillus mucilaginosus]AFH62141.1 hypothetical protein B2K_15665 [Paenibacillus mucilaginosus K02]